MDKLIGDENTDAIGRTVVRGLVFEGISVDVSYKVSLQLLISNASFLAFPQ